MEKIETFTAILSLNNTYAIQFINVPDGYKLIKHKIKGKNGEKVITKKLGKLKQFNRLKVFRDYKTERNDVDFVKLFTEGLQNINWDFEKYPNPMAYLIHVSEQLIAVNESKDY